MTVQCCRCKKVREEKRWVVPTGALPEQVSHGFCPDCLAATRKEFEEEQRAFALAKKESRLRARWAADAEAVGYNY